MANGRQGTTQVLYDEWPMRYKLETISSIFKLAGWTLTRYWLAYKALVVELCVGRSGTVGYINSKGYHVYIPLLPSSS